MRAFILTITDIYMVKQSKISEFCPLSPFLASTARQGSLSPPGSLHGQVVSSAVLHLSVQLSVSFNDALSYGQPSV